MRPCRQLAMAAMAAACVLAVAPAHGGKPASSPAPAAAEAIHYGPGRVLAELASRQITESSGLAASRLAPGVFWTHNDSGDRARIYAFDVQGRDLGSFDVLRAQAVDWEDIASFTRDGASYLLIADTGDNDRHHATSTLYLLAEPRLEAAGRRRGRSEVLRRIDFAYEDGPHDCEGVAVDVTGGKIYLATKALLPISRIYELPLPEATAATSQAAAAPASAPAAGKEVLTARRIATVSVSMATGMDISPDGRRLVICNYSEAVEFDRHPSETWAKALDRAGRKIALPSRKQGESVCYGADGRTLYLTSEQRPTPLIEVPPAEDAAAETPDNKRQDTNKPR